MRGAETQKAPDTKTNFTASPQYILQLGAVHLRAYPEHVVNKEATEKKAANLKADRMSHRRMPLSQKEQRD